MLKSIFRYGHIDEYGDAQHDYGYNHPYKSLYGPIKHGHGRLHGVIRAGPKAHLGHAPAHLGHAPAHLGHAPHPHGFGGPHLGIGGPHLGAHPHVGPQHGHGHHHASVSGAHLGGHQSYGFGTGIVAGQGGKFGF